MVAENEEDDFESSQVLAKKVDQANVLRVANVPEQRKIWCCWSYFKEIVRRWSLQMEIRENLFFAMMVVVNGNAGGGDRCFGLPSTAR